MSCDRAETGGSAALFPEPQPRAAPGLLINEARVSTQPLGLGVVRSLSTGSGRLDAISLLQTHDPLCRHLGVAFILGSLAGL